MTNLDAIILAIGLIIIFSIGCASTSNRRELLQKEFPECAITNDFEVICPIPDFHH